MENRPRVTKGMTRRPPNRRGECVTDSRGVPRLHQDCAKTRVVRLAREILPDIVRRRLDFGRPLGAAHLVVTVGRGTEAARLGRIEP